MFIGVLRWFAPPKTKAATQRTVLFVCDALWALREGHSESALRSESRCECEFKCKQSMLSLSLALFLSVHDSVCRKALLLIDELSLPRNLCEIKSQITRPFSSRNELMGLKGRNSVWAQILNLSLFVAQNSLWRSAVARYVYFSYFSLSVHIPI